MRVLAAAIGLALSLPSFADGPTIAPIGNFQYDFNHFSDDVRQFEDEAAPRRARLGLQVKHERYEVKLEFDIEPMVWTDAFVKIPGIGPGALRVGQYKMPIGLEEVGSSKWITFMERGLPTALDLARRVAIEYGVQRPNWTAALAVHGQNFDGTSDSRGVAARGTWAPINDDRGLVHFGAALATEDPDSNTARFRARPEARLTDIRLVDTGELRNVEDIHRAGLEAAWLRGPWSVQAEWLYANATRSTGGDVSGQGAYAFVSWFPLGGGRTYKNGAFDAPTLGDHNQALELGLRYSRLDLDDGSVQGGTESDWTLGATWYATKNVRFMANYVDVSSDRRGISDAPSVVEFRAQVVF